MYLIVKSKDQCIIFGVVVGCISAIDEDESCRKLRRCISVIFQRLDFQELEMHLRNLSVCFSFLLFLLVGLLVVIVSRLSDLLTCIVADRDDRLRHGRIAQHASIQRKKSQVLEARVPSSLVHAEASTSRAHISSHSSSRGRRVTHSDTSLPPSSRRRQVSPIKVQKHPSHRRYLRH